VNLKTILLSSFQISLLPDCHCLIRGAGPFPSRPLQRFCLRCHVQNLLLSYYLSRINPKKNFSCITCDHQLCDLARLLLDYPASDAPSLSLILSSLISGRCIERSPRSRETRVQFPGRVRPKYFKSCYSQLPCLMFSI